MRSKSSVTSHKMSRRQFLVAGSTISGAFVLGVPFAHASEHKENVTRQLGFFIEIQENGHVIIGSNQPEIGQGVRTALPMLVAEELDVEWENVSIRPMPLGIVRTADGFAWKYGGQGVGGSTGLTGNWNFMRQVGATARHQLIQAAAARWNVEPDACHTEPGYVVSRTSGERISYASLVSEAAQLAVPEEDVPLKPQSEYRIVGTHQKNLEVRDIVTGKAKYGIDTRQPNMHFARHRSESLVKRYAYFLR